MIWGLTTYMNSEAFFVLNFRNDSFLIQIEKKTIKMFNTLVGQSFNIFSDRNLTKTLLHWYSTQTDWATLTLNTQELVLLSFYKI